MLLIVLITFIMEEKDLQDQNFMPARLIYSPILPHNLAKIPRIDTRDTRINESTHGIGIRFRVHTGTSVLPQSANYSLLTANSSSASGWQTFKYGKLGEVIENIRTFALPFENQTYTFRMQYEYDPFNRIQSMLYPDSERVEYGYNLGGMLERVAGNKNGVTYRYIDSILRTITRRHARYAEHLTSPVPVGGSAQRCAFRGTTVSCAEAKGEYGRQGVRWDYATRCVPPIFPSPVAATRASFRRTPSHPWPRLATTVWRNLLRHGQHRRMMNPLPGICPAHRTVSGYRHASPHGDGPSSSTSSCVARASRRRGSTTCRDGW